MRSRSGPDILDRYLWMSGGVQEHGRRSLPWKPQGQGFIAPIIKFLGYDPFNEPQSFPEKLKICWLRMGLTQEELARGYRIGACLMIADLLILGGPEDRCSATIQNLK
jgi:hypothetical protein